MLGGRVGEIKDKAEAGAMCDVDETPEEPDNVEEHTGYLGDVIMAMVGMTRNMRWGYAGRQLEEALRMYVSGTHMPDIYSPPRASTWA